MRIVEAYAVIAPGTCRAIGDPCVHRSWVQGGIVPVSSVFPVFDDT